jgi:1-acyl-sn-glycerol-3-phosphate acyltransferase
MTGLAGWAASLFQRIEVRGGEIPPGPVMVVANHQNALLDPLVVFRVAGRPTRPLAKAPLFRQRILGTVLRGLGGLPVYRKQDDPVQMHRNDETFRAAIDALHAGDALQIFPEGRSHSGPSVEPLKTGAARIALAAEAERQGALGLRLVPIGLTWEKKDRFQGRVLAEIGEPFSVTPWLTPEGAENQDAVRALTDEIATRLREVTLNLSDREDLGLITAADRIYSRAKAMHGHRERDSLADRVPRLRKFAEALAWVREREPVTYRELAREVHRIDMVERALGVEEGGVPPRYPLGAVLRYTIREGVALLVGFPLAMVGSVVWYPAWLLPRWVVAWVRPEPESVATYKLATSFFTVPLTVLVGAAVGWYVGGALGVVTALVGVPAVGIVALAWRARWGKVREDALLYFRVLTRPRLRDRLAGLREDLVRGFDGVVRRMET